ncbi:YqiA/YcfP family alpha/beta fold hydrolase [Shewanella acanthi]|uniref:YqiA/YcfP family alpha/beta fold hydrolase n=1 Tax=Shewanella acanthi TaxID=2864212 RepID=UPI001C65AEC8|nr:YqiA/YcfP family alpha/beta fold hydrolase [Shewanella acanthi]QYJ79449.1 esterase YqiA [Shewanella acanthi]
MLLYIHGFNSSPFSDKAVMTAQYMAKHHPKVDFHQPQLPNTPKAAMELLMTYVESAIKANEPLNFIGSSLGGYFASFLAEHFGGRAVLVNPAVKPFELFDGFLGEQFNPYTQEHYVLLPEHRTQVAEFNTPVIRNPDRFLVLLQTGDEVLDYQEALHKYHHCQLRIEAGGDHSFVGYERYLQAISQFLQLP